MKLTKQEAIKVCEKFGVKLNKFWLLGRGAHNENFILETNKGIFVLRIVNVKNEERLKREYKILKKLNGKFGPKVYLFDSSKKIINRNYLLEEYIKGEFAPEKANKKLIIDTARFLRKLHSSSKVPVNIKRDLIYSSLDRYFKSYIKDIQRLRKVLEKRNNKILKEIDHIFEETRIISINNKRLLNNRKKKVVIHGNVDPEHIVYVKGKIKLIDWEFSRYGLEESDLIFFAYLYNLKPKELNLLLKEYGYPKNDLRKKQFNILFLLHHLGLIIWSLERIEEIKRGEIYKNQRSSNVRGMIEHIKLHLNRGNELLKKLK